MAKGFGSGGGSTHDAEDDLPLPKDFKSIRDILDVDNKKIRVGSLINVCGIVKDFRTPMPTQKTDYKATMTLYDISTEHEYNGIEFSIFRPRDNIPQVNAGDVVLLYNVKVQSWNNNPISLITNHKTAIRVYAASKIPRHPRPATKALQPRVGKELEKNPSQEEDAYVSHFYHKIDKGSVPQPEEFELMVSRSGNIKQKFTLLQDIEDRKFCDLIVQACRDPFDQGDKVTLYVSDYTENSCFFHYTSDGVHDLDSGDGDVYGYTTRRRDGASANDWVGPYGKRTIQITAWEPHATVIREEVEAGDWLSLKNVQIKIGRDGKHLEGVMREERNLVNSQRVNVMVYNLETEDQDAIDPRLKDAIRRCRDYVKGNKQPKPSKPPEKKRKSTGGDTDDRPPKAFERNRRHTAAEADDKPLGTSDGKRKHVIDATEESGKKNSRARRKRLRAGAQKRVEEQKAMLKEEVLGLNPLIMCECPADLDPTPISSLLEQQYYETTIDGDKMRLPLPFVNAKYCVNVRVVDFHPKRLEDFARPWRRKKKAFDVLSDDDSAPSSEDDEEDSADDSDAPSWEWRFALLLEEVSPRAKDPKQVWAVVNNMEAQLLTSLDATNLRKDDVTLAALREKMFTLWGTLEERKDWELRREEEAMKRTPGASPPPTASDDEDGRRRSRGSKALEGLAPKVLNKAFTCCVKQYGVREKKTDPALADAYSSHKWRRVFGLFGTKISS